MKWNDILVSFICVGTVIGLLYTCNVLGVFTPTDVWFQACAALLGVVFTSIVTYLLIKGQSNSDEQKERNTRLFERKLEIYSRFNEKLWEADDMSKVINLRTYLTGKLLLVLNPNIFDNFQVVMKELLKAMSQGPSKYNRVKGKITKLLREDLENSKVAFNRFNIDSLLDVFDQNDELQESVSSPVNQSTTVQTPEKTAKETVSVTDTWQHPELRHIVTNKITCWHFAAMNPDVQWEVLQDKKKPDILSLLEYEGQNWRTERMQQIQKGDVVLLFCKGGSGYVGAYRALEIKVIKKEDFNDGDYQYDIYGGYDDGADLISGIIVEKIFENINDIPYDYPIGAIRQTIVRLNPVNAEKVLRFLDKC